MTLGVRKPLKWNALRRDGTWQVLGKDVEYLTTARQRTTQKELYPKNSPRLSSGKSKRTTEPLPSGNCCAMPLAFNVSGCRWKIDASRTSTLDSLSVSGSMIAIARSPSVGNQIGQLLKLFYFAAPIRKMKLGSDVTVDSRKNARIKECVNTEALPERTPEVVVADKHRRHDADHQSDKSDKGVRRHRFEVL